MAERSASFHAFSLKHSLEPQWIRTVIDSETLKSTTSLGIPLL